MSPTQIGRRVVVRYRLRPEPDGSPPPATYTDVLGILESWTAGVLTIRRRDGELVDIPEADIVAGKPIPQDPPPRRHPRRS